MKSGIISLLVLAMFIPAMAVAGPLQGSTELELYGNFSATDSTTSAFAGLNYGYFLSSNINVNGGIVVSGQDAEASGSLRGTEGLSNGGESGGEETITIGGSLGMKYLLTPEVSTMYLAADAIIYDLDNASETLSGAAFVGYLQYISDSTALFYEVGYSLALDDLGEDRVVGNLGITVYFD